jgi:hypothetical protein
VSSQEHRDRADKRGIKSDSTDPIQYNCSEIGTDSSVLEYAGCCITIPTEFVKYSLCTRFVPRTEVSTNSVSRRGRPRVCKHKSWDYSFTCAEAGVSATTHSFPYVLQLRSWRQKGKGTDAHAQRGYGTNYCNPPAPSRIGVYVY